MADAAKKKKALPKGRHTSQIKRERQSLKRRERNVSAVSAVKTAVKKVKDAVLGKNKETAATLLKSASRVIQKTASKGILHKKNASRRISRLATLVNSL